MKIFNIFYGDFSGNGSQTVALTNYLAGNLGNSSWYDILSSYYRIVNGKKVFVQGSLSFAGSYNLFPTWRRNSTTVATIRQNIASYIFDRGIVKPDPNTIYAVIFRGDFSVSTNAGSWLIDWCGVHNGIFLTNDNNFYPIFMVGDMSSVDAELQFPCSVDLPPPNGIAADSVANTYAHEVAEVITDPKLNLDYGWTFDPGPDRISSPWENADECAWIFTKSFVHLGAKNYSLQKNWQPGTKFEIFL